MIYIDQKSYIYISIFLKINKIFFWGKYGIKAKINIKEIIIGKFPTLILKLKLIFRFKEKCKMIAIINFEKSFTANFENYKP